MVGLVNNGIGYLLYLFITYFVFAPKITMTLLYLVGATMGFFCNRKITFTHKGPLIDSGPRYLLVHLGGYLINFVILSVFTDKFGYPHQIVQACAILIVAIYLFGALKFIVFREN
jgi:putative flippase GtrA